MSNADDDPILGTGIAFPLRFDGGQLALNSGRSQVEQSIRLILGTSLGERRMRPDFGGGLEDLVFEPMSAVTAALVERRVTQALQRFEPRIDVLGVTVAVSADTSAGELTAGISYMLRATGSVFNMVYPFYLNAGGA